MEKAAERLVFIDETSLNTKMVKTTGWSPVGQRLIDHSPFGHWHTQTFIAALRHDGLTAPWVIDGPINLDVHRKSGEIPPHLSGHAFILHRADVSQI